MMAQLYFQRFVIFIYLFLLYKVGKNLTPLRRQLLPPNHDHTIDKNIINVNGQTFSDKFSNLPDW